MTITKKWITETILFNIRNEKTPQVYEPATQEQIQNLLWTTLRTTGNAKRSR